MSIGASLFLIAAGAILRYAITWNPRDVNIDTVGLILLIVGVVGLCLSLLWMFMATERRRETATRPAQPPRPPRDRDVY
jgi:hypothetical protein